MNSKSFMSLSFVFAVLVAFADPNAPQVTACTATQDPVTHLVAATYTLDEPAVVTFDVKTNGVSIGGANLTHAYGDVHRVVAAGEHTLYWQADKAWQGHRLSSASFEVVAWATNAPPDYMVVDLVVKKGERTYYISPDQLPDGGVTNRKYTLFLLFDLILQLYEINLFFRICFKSGTGRIAPVFVLCVDFYVYRQFLPGLCEPAAYIRHRTCAVRCQ